jgi:tetratricopeptide (TPR) repeat protein
VNTSGEIVDFTGRQLMLKRPGGREELIEPARVVDVQSEWTAPHQTANELFASRKYAAALDAYREALAVEQRGWVRRRILAQAVWCLQYLDQTAPAIDLFLELVRQDPASLHFDAIPLAWLTRLPDAGLQRRAQQLLETQDSQVAILIGASWLLPAAQRTRSLEALRGLLAAEDPRVALLAEAQLWRAQTAVAKPDDIDRWQERIRRMPHEVRAGPTFLVAQTLARLDRPADAAIAFLQVPILFPRRRELASQSLLEAAGQLEKIGDRDAAGRLRREREERWELAGER